MSNPYCNFLFDQLAVDKSILTDGNNNGWDKQFVDLIFYFRYVLE